MPRYRDSFMAEVARFERCCPLPAHEPEPVGLAQFFAFESQGIEPAEPSPYFVRLLNGKRWWEWQLNEMARTYGTDEWWGWATIEDDWRNDPRAVRQLRQRIGLAN